MKELKPALLAVIGATVYRIVGLAYADRGARP
jgi:hypothetical protein